MLGVILEIKTEPNSYIKVLPENRAFYADRKGYIKLNLSGGEKVIIISNVAYKSETLKINLSSDTLILVRLEPKTYILPEVFVSSEEGEFKKGTFEPYRVNYEILRNSPNFIEPDPIRVLSRVPSTKFSSDLGLKASFLNSPPEETVYFLDGIRVFNPVHLGGLSSVLDANMLSSAEIYTIPYHSEIFGLSGFVSLNSITQFNVMDRKFFDLSFISAKGGAVKDLGEGFYAFSVRGFHLAYISLLAGRNLPYQFYDGFFKFGRKGFEVLFLGSRGFFNFHSERTQIDANWSNFISYARYQKGLIETKGYIADYGNDVFANGYKSYNPIRLYGFSAGLKGERISLGFVSEYYDLSYVSSKRADTVKRLINDLYAQFTQTLGNFNLSGGLRTDGKYLDPNLSVKFFLSEAVSLRGIFSITRDNFYGFPMEGEGLFRFYYFMPSFYTLVSLPQRAYFGGFEVVRRTSRYSAFAQVIYRKYLRLYQDFRDTTGRSYSINLGYNGRIFGSSLSLWYSYTKREPKTITDAPHALGISQSLNLWGKNFGYSFGYHTGYPSYTSENERYPDYHRLDIFVSGNLNIYRFRGSWNFTVINVYNRKNVFLVYYDEKEKRYRTVPQLPFAPTLNLSLEF